MNNAMKCATRSIRVSVLSLMAVSLAAVMFCPQLHADQARSVAKREHKCCCGTCDGKCCGMACCKLSHSQDPLAIPPARTSSDFKSLVLLSWVAPSTSSAAGIVEGIHRASELAAALSLPTLQSEHVRIQT